LREVAAQPVDALRDTLERTGPCEVVSNICPSGDPKALSRSSWVTDRAAAMLARARTDG
jgi:hypothetical protein